jgi:5-dehydro-2-deoxygluconokinase
MRPERGDWMIMPTDSNRLLFILADDHRDSLEKQLYKIEGAPTPAQAARIAADKLLVYRALLQASASLSSDARAGILVDEQYGADVAELAANSQGLVNLTMPIEASGHEWLEFAYGDDWKSHAEFFSTNHSKILIRDNPGLPERDRLSQAERVAEISDWAHQADRPLIIELLVPATDHDLSTVAGDTKRYDDEVRPRLTVESISFLQDHGANPTLWKVEGMNGSRDAASIVEVARRGGRDAQCIVLGRHASKADLDHWLEIAAPLDGYVGFAIGRSIWWDALTNLLDETIDEDAAIAQISSAYLDYANDYLAARG